MMKQYTQKQRQAIKLARDRLKNKLWYRGVCVDKLPQTDQEIDALGGIEEVADMLVADTEHWDNW